MLAKIKLYFEQFITIQNISPEQQKHALNLAVAAIMLEMVNMDNQIDDTEMHQLKSALQQQCGISDQEFKELHSLAEDALEYSTDYYQFTSLINNHFSSTEKQKIIVNLWKLANADGKIDSHESHYLRKIADLLHVPHSEFIKAKLKVLEN